MRSARQDAIKRQLPETTVKTAEMVLDKLLPYMDEHESNSYWLAISNAFLDGKGEGLREWKDALEDAQRQRGVR